MAVEPRAARVLRLAALAALVLAAAACGGSGSESGKEAAEASGSGAVTDLTSVDQLRERFNADAGKLRLIVLASPT
jgi:ABC-type glycerol-3-phosphate transport system substrate-binding protein